MEISVTVNNEEVKRDLARLSDALGGSSKRRELMEVLGKGLEQDLHRHFIRRNAEPSKPGLFNRPRPKQNFWARMRRATAHTNATEESATVTVADPAMSARVRGATIKPTAGRKYLAIPVRENAHGVEPRSGLIPGLFPKRSGRGTLFLMRREEDGSLRAYYLLTRSVEHPADPEALPKDDKIVEAAERRARSWLGRLGGGSA